MALLAACRADRPALMPRPMSVDPPLGYGTASTAITIQGEGFYVRGVQVASGGSRIETRHRVWVGTAELRDVTWVDAQTLRAVVPAGLTGGTYDLAVENPFGDRGTLPSAFRVIDGSPAALRATVETTPIANLGQYVSVTVTVTNDGDATALALAPTLSIAGSGGLSPLGAPPAAADVPARGSRAFVWSFQASGVGETTVTVTGGGRDGITGAEVALGPASATLSVLAPGALAIQIVSAPEQVNLGQRFDVVVRVQNTGDSDGTRVALTLAIPNATPATDTVALGTIPGGASRDVTRSFTGASAGITAVSATAAGTDAIDGTALTASITQPIVVQEPAALSATLSLPAAVVLGDFTATLTVVNTGGGSALAVSPPAGPLAAGAGTASITYLSGPAGAAADLAAGQEATFTWVYRVSSTGTLQLSVTVTGTDAVSGAPLIASSTSNVATVPEAVPIASDPFADGTTFASLTSYHGQLWVGPNRDGTQAVKMNLDGTAQQTVALAFPKDIVSSGSQSANTWALAPPYQAIGFLGCQTNTAACGPDNENGRGLFTSVSFAGAEWLVAIGAKPGGSLRYAYMTPDTVAPLPFRYVDLSQQLSAETRTASAVAALGSRLYLGFPGKGAQSPFLIALSSAPSSPGLNPIDGPYATTLDMSRLPSLGASGNPKNGSAVILVDALAAFSNRLYVANNGGFGRSTTPVPGPYATAPSDWTSCTPATVVKTAVTTAKQSELEPADKAVPQMAAVGGRLLAIRNVYLSGTTGPVGGQLWRCAPTALDPADAQPQCGPTDWSLVIPDDGSDGRGAATLLVASSRYLYLGFNRAGGARVYRTPILDPGSISDFTGQAGCVAGSAGCQGLGGDGFGDTRNSRILDARVVTDPLGTNALYVSAGDPTATPGVAVHVYRIAE